MADRHRFTITIACPACGNAGQAQVSEGDRPVMRSPEFRVDALPDGFALAQASTYRHETEIACRCGRCFKL